MKFTVSLLIAIAMLFTSSPSVEASTCRNAGPKQSNLSLASQVDGRIFTICANQTSITRSKSTKPRAKTKPVKNNPKVNPVGQVVFTYQRFGRDTRVTFKPVAPKAKRVTTGNLEVNQPVSFSIDQKVKLGASYVFGNRLGVRFTPIKVEVRFSDGTRFSTFQLTRVFAKPGTYRLVALVTYRVEYRKLFAGEYVNKKGAKWVLDPGTIALVSNPVTISIGNTPVNRVVLVSQ